MAMAPCEKNGVSTTIVGYLAQPVRNAFFGLFHLAYRNVKTYGPFTHLGPDAMAATLMGINFNSHGSHGSQCFNFSPCWPLLVNRDW